MTMTASSRPAHDLAAPSPDGGEEDQARRPRSGWLPAIYLAVPLFVLFALFLVPMALLALISVGMGINGAESMWSIEAYTSLLTDPLYLEIARTTIIIATSAMVIQLVVGVPLAYIMAFKAGRFEIPMLLGLVVLDELNPVVRIYAWRSMLGRNGAINRGLESIGLIDEPLEFLLYSRFAVTVALVHIFLPYGVLVIYAGLAPLAPSYL